MKIPHLQSPAWSLFSLLSIVKLLLPHLLLLSLFLTFFRFLWGIYWKWEIRRWRLSQMSIRLAPLSLGKRLLRLAQLSNRPSVVRCCFCPPLACHCLYFKCPLQAVGGGSCSWPEEVVEWSGPTVALLCHSFLSSLGKLDLNESYTRVWVSDIVARVTLRSDTVLPFLPSTWPLSSHTTTIPISNAMQGIGKLFLCAIQSILKLWQVFGNMRVPTLDSHYAKCPKISHDMRFDIFTITYFFFIVPFLHFCGSLPCLSSAFQNSSPLSEVEPLPTSNKIISFQLLPLLRTVRAC